MYRFLFLLYFGLCFMQGNETVTMLLFNFKVSYANYAENTGKGESIVRTVSEYMESALNEFLFFLSYFYDVFISFIFTWYKGALNRFCFLFFFTIVMVSYVSNGSGKLARTWTDKKIKTWERLSLTHCRGRRFTYSMAWGADPSCLRSLDSLSTLKPLPAVSYKDLGTPYFLR